MEVIDLMTVLNMFGQVFTASSLTIVVLIQFNCIVGGLVSAYIKKSRNADLGLQAVPFWKRYLIYHALAFLFYSISLLSFLTGKSFDEVF